MTNEDALSIIKEYVRIYLLDIKLGAKVKSNMNKVINVVRASLPPFEEYVEEISDIWESRWLTHTGPKHQQLEKDLESFLDTPNVELFSNGHMALELALRVLKVKGEVITTPFTFASTTQAIADVGLTPVFCDINETDYTMDVDKIEDLITEKTEAIVPVHVYGNICDYKKIEEIAEKHHLKVIYDAAHAFGETIDGKNAANLGDVSMFSFHATKVFNTVEGGGLTFADDALCKEFAAIRQFGMYGKEDAEMLGTNAKMTEFHAAMGLCNLRHVLEEIDKRKMAYERYIERLTGVEGIYICPQKENVSYNYAYFPVRFNEEIFGKSRDQMANELIQNGIVPRKYFYPLTSDFTIIKEKFVVQDTPIAGKIADEILTLPLYAGLSEEEVDRICDIVMK